MVDSEKRNGAESAGRLEKERERLEREREALEREREKLEREREKVERAQEEMETRLERQEERLEQLEEELEAREEALGDAAEELEVEGIEGIREMLDVVSDRIPHLMRGMHESVYSPEQVQATAQAFASFYKTLVDSGMPDVLAAEMTRQHFDNLQSQMQMQMKPRKSKHGCGGGDIPGPDFDPLGPNFDPFRRSQRSKPAQPAERAEPAEACEPCSESPVSQ
jgi:chromosome segregation ATPase